MAGPQDQPITIRTRSLSRPACPRCGSELIVIGRLTDDHGNAVQFSSLDRFGGYQVMGPVRACYCNDCGEVTCTLE